MRWLSPKTHGILDYVASAVFVTAPILFMIDEHTSAVFGCYLIAAVLLMTSLLTRYPLGAVKLIPFRLHGTLEFVAAPLIIAYPWIAGFSEVPAARSFFVGSGAALFVLWAITDYRAADAFEQAEDRGIPRHLGTSHA
jgi:hypothetical protein